MGIPTHEDAKLLMDLMRMRHEPQFPEAETWFLHEFQAADWPTLRTRCPDGSPNWIRVETVLDFWELVGALVDNGLLNDDLLFDVQGSLDPIWQRVEPWILAARQEKGLDTWENLELLVERQRHWRRMHRAKSTRL